MVIKYLDLDAIHKPEGRVKIGNVEYDVYPMKIKTLINLSVLKTIDEAKDEESQTEAIRSALDVISEIFPACPRESLDDLSMNQLGTLVEFANNLGEETAEKNSEAPTRKGKPKK